MNKSIRVNKKNIFKTVMTDPSSATLTSDMTTLAVQRPENMN
jgi:hypothetical protein